MTRIMTAVPAALCLAGCGRAAGAPTAAQPTAKKSAC